MRLTVLASALLVLLTAFLGAACDDDDEPTQSVPLSCSGLRALSHYQYRVDYKVGHTSEDDVPSSGREALRLAIDGELVGYTISGRVVKPDRKQEFLNYPGGQIELRTIEGQFWVKVGETFQEESSPDGDLPTAESLCDFVAPLIVNARTEVAPDSTYVFESETQHYHLNLENGEDLAPLFGEEAFGHYTIDLWLAKDGRWPSNLVIQSNNGEADDQRAYRLVLEMTDPNDISLRVDKPQS